MPRRKVARGETLFWIPFSQDDASAENEISEALRALGSRRLLRAANLREREKVGTFAHDYSKGGKDGEGINVSRPSKAFRLDGFQLAQSCVAFLHPLERFASDL